MGRTGLAHLPLHGGKAPKWLFTRMVALSKSIMEVMLMEFGTDMVLTRLSDPYWFQALSCVLGYDWHSSGTTTVTCGALKEAIDPETHGIAFCGGKGAASRRTLDDIVSACSCFNVSTETIDRFRYASRMTAKVDSSAIQDEYSLYHHVFFFSEKKKWAVIQQGMNTHTQYARRYHWSSEHLNGFLNEPHQGILSAEKREQSLDMTARVSEASQKISVDLINDNPYHLRTCFAQLQLPSTQVTLDNLERVDNKTVKTLDMPRFIDWEKLRELYEFQPKNYEELLSCKGLGPSTVRALALVSDLIFGEPPSWEDPVKYSFTVGGKDGVPFPVDRKAMDDTIFCINQGIHEAVVGNKEKMGAFRALSSFIPN